MGWRFLPHSGRQSCASWGPRALRQHAPRSPRWGRRPRHSPATSSSRAARAAIRTPASRAPAAVNGGVGLGPNGSNQWLQVGLNAFHGTGTNLYYEVAAGGNTPSYHEIAANIAPGKKLRVAVLEMAKRPHHWRVWVDGKPVSRPIFLRGSSGRFEPIATAETWGGGSKACNRFAYRFDRLAVAAGRGGSWHRFVQAHRFHDPGYRLVRNTASTSFVAAIT